MSRPVPEEDVMFNPLRRIFGLDVHAETIYVTAMSAGTPDEQYELDLENLDKFIAQLRPDDHLALEATTNSYYIYRRLKVAVPHGKVALANPVKLKMIAQSGAKTDRNDSRTLALLLALGKLPEVWVPDERTQEDRDLLYHRAALIKERTRTLNRIRSLLTASGLRCSRSSLKCKEARSFLAGMLNLSVAKRFVLDNHLERLDHLDGQLRALDAQIELRVDERPEHRLLATLPGVASLVGLTILAVVGTIERFASPDSLANYAGMVPRVRSSAKRVKHGSITKAGSRMLRWAVVEAVQQLRRHSPSFRRLYQRLHRRRGKAIATIACGRRLLEVVWCMLSRQEPFQEAKPEAVERKEKRRRQRMVKALADIATSKPHRVVEHLATLRELAARGQPRGALPLQLCIPRTNEFAAAPSG